MGQSKYITTLKTDGNAMYFVRSLFCTGFILKSRCWHLKLFMVFLQSTYRILFPSGKYLLINLGQGIMVFSWSILLVKWWLHLVIGLFLWQHVPLIVARSNTSRPSRPGLQFVFYMFLNLWNELTCFGNALDSLKFIHGEKRCTASLKTLSIKIRHV